MVPPEIYPVMKQALRNFESIVCPVTISRDSPGLRFLSVCSPEKNQNLGESMLRQGLVCSCPVALTHLIIQAFSATLVKDRVVG